MKKLWLAENITKRDRLESQIEDEEDMHEILLNAFN